MSKMLLPLFALFMIFAMPQGHAAGGQARTDTLTATLSDAVMTGENRAAAVLDIELAPGWHTYWRAPGEAGLAPVLNTNKTPAIQSASFEWPYPVRIEEMGIVTFGYKEHVAFPLNFEMREGTPPDVIALSADIMVCKDICIPEKIELQTSLTRDSADALAALAAARQKVPQPDHPELRIETIEVTGDDIVISARNIPGFEAPSVFVTANQTAFTKPAEWVPDPSDLARMTIKQPKNPGTEDLSAFLKGKTLSVTLVSGTESTEKAATF